MRRIAALIIASLCAIAVSGCIVVPPRHGYYHDRGGYSDRGHDHDYRGR
ncbi:hypothetical protein ACFJGW_20710 [Burkholderiaceae bacterium UC74_6]